MAESTSQHPVATDVVSDRTYKYVASTSYECLNSTEDNSNSYSRIVTAQLAVNSDYLMPVNSDYLMPVNEPDFGYLVITDSDYPPTQAAASGTNKFRPIECCDDLEMGKTDDKGSSGRNEQELNDSVHNTNVPAPLFDQEVAATVAVVYNSSAATTPTYDNNVSHVMCK
jgi:hypothetical protein